MPQDLAILGLAVETEQAEKNLRRFNKALNRSVKQQKIIHRQLRSVNSSFSFLGASIRTVLRPLELLPKSIRAVLRPLDLLAKSMKAALGGVKLLARGFFNLNRAYQIFAAILAANEIRKFADDYQLLANRVSLVTKSEYQHEKVLRKVYRIAQDTRNALYETGDLYVRIAMTAGDLGATQKNFADVTKAVAQSIQISGANARTAQGALIQLGQAFSIGFLRGDEFRSVSEALPGLMDQIAKYAGVTRGQLRELAYAGKLTSQLLFDAILDRRDEIDELFSKTVPTIAQGFRNLQNSFTIFFGRFFKALDTSSLGKFMTEIGDIIANVPTRDLELWANGLNDIINGMVKDIKELVGQFNSFTDMILNLPAVKDTRFAKMAEDIGLVNTSFLMILEVGRKARVLISFMIEAVPIAFRVLKSYFDYFSEMPDFLMKAFKAFISGMTGVVTAIYQNTFDLTKSVLTELNKIFKKIGEGIGYVYENIGPIFGDLDGFVTAFKIVLVTTFMNLRYDFEQLGIYFSEELPTDVKIFGLKAKKWIFQLAYDVDGFFAQIGAGFASVIEDIKYDFDILSKDFSNIFEDSIDGIKLFFLELKYDLYDIFLEINKGASEMVPDWFKEFFGSTGIDIGISNSLERSMREISLQISMITNAGSNRESAGRFLRPGMRSPAGQRELDLVDYRRNENIIIALGEVTGELDSLLKNRAISSFRSFGEMSPEAMKYTQSERIDYQKRYEKYYSKTTEDLVSMFSDGFDENVIQPFLDNFGKENIKALEDAFSELKDLIENAPSLNEADIKDFNALIERYFGKDGLFYQTEQRTADLAEKRSKAPAGNLMPDKTIMDQFEERYDEFLVKIAKIPAVEAIPKIESQINNLNEQVEKSRVSVEFYTFAFEQLNATLAFTRLRGYAEEGTKVTGILETLADSTSKVVNDLSSEEPVTRMMELAKISQTVKDVVGSIPNSSFFTGALQYGGQALGVISDAQMKARQEYESSLTQSMADRLAIVREENAAQVTVGVEAIQFQQEQNALEKEYNRQVELNIDAGEEVLDTLKFQYQLKSRLNELEFKATQEVIRQSREAKALENLQSAKYQKYIREASQMPVGFMGSNIELKTYIQDQAELNLLEQERAQVLSQISEQNLEEIRLTNELYDIRKDMLKEDQDYRKAQEKYGPKGGFLGTGADLIVGPTETIKGKTFGGVNIGSVIEGAMGNGAKRITDAMDAYAAGGGGMTGAINALVSLAMSAEHIQAALQVLADPITQIVDALNPLTQMVPVIESLEGPLVALKRALGPLEKTFALIFQELANLLNTFFAAFGANPQDTPNKLRKKLEILEGLSDIIEDAASSIETLTSTIAGLEMSTLSLNTSAERVTAAQNEYNRLLAIAQETGKAADVSKVASFAKTYLETAFEIERATSVYAGRYSSVTKDLESLGTTVEATAKSEFEIANEELEALGFTAIDFGANVSEAAANLRSEIEATQILLDTGYEYEGKDIIEMLGEAVSNIGTQLAEGFWNIWNQLMGGVSDLGAVITDILGGVGDAIFEGLNDLFSTDLASMDLAKMFFDGLPKITLDLMKIGMFHGFSPPVIPKIDLESFLNEFFAVTMAFQIAADDFLKGIGLDLDNAPDLWSGIADIFDFGDLDPSSITTGLFDFGDLDPSTIVTGLFDFGELDPSSVVSGLFDFGELDPESIVSGLFDFTDLSSWNPIEDVQDLISLPEKAFDPIGLISGKLSLPKNAFDPIGLISGKLSLPKNAFDPIGLISGKLSLPKNAFDPIGLISGKLSLPKDAFDPIGLISGKLSLPKDAFDPLELIKSKIDLTTEFKPLDMIKDALTSALKIGGDDNTIKLLKNPFYAAKMGPEYFLEFSFAKGGLARGPSHANGGMPGIVAGRQPIEFEGGEYIINKKTVSLLGPGFFDWINSITAKAATGGDVTKLTGEGSKNSSGLFNQRASIGGSVGDLLKQVLGFNGLKAEVGLDSASFGTYKAANGGEIPKYTRGGFPRIDMSYHPPYIGEYDTRRRTWSYSVDPAYAYMIEENPSIFLDKISDALISSSTANPKNADALMAPSSTTTGASYRAGANFAGGSVNFGADIDLARNELYPMANLTTIKNLVQIAIDEALNISKEIAGWLQSELPNLEKSVQNAIKPIIDTVTDVGKSAGDTVKDFIDDLIPGLETGGMIYGPRHSAGGVMANLEGGEFVMNRRAVNAYGADFMNAVNDRTFNLERLMDVLGGSEGDNKIEVHVYTDMRGEAKAAISQYRAEVRERQQRMRLPVTG